MNLNSESSNSDDESTPSDSFSQWMDLFDLADDSDDNDFEVPTSSARNRRNRRGRRRNSLPSAIELEMDNSRFGDYTSEKLLARIPGNSNLHVLPTFKYLLTNHMLRFGLRPYSLKHLQKLKKCEIKLRKSISTHEFNLGEIKFELLQLIESDFGGSQVNASSSELETHDINTINSSTNEIYIYPKPRSGFSNTFLIWNRKRSDVHGVAYTKLERELRKLHSAREGQLMFTYEEQKEYYFKPSILNLNFNRLWLNDLSEDAFRLTFVNYNSTTGILTVNVSMNNSLISSHDLIETIPATVHNDIPDLLGYFFGLNPLDSIRYGGQYEREDIEWFFEQISSYHNNEQIDQVPYSLQHSALIPTLREYQKDAIRWMLHKENNGGGNGQGRSAVNDTVNVVNLAETFCTKMYIPAVLKRFNGESLDAYYNPFVGAFSNVLPKIENGYTGMLCDEMGLGKTLEVLGLILLNTMDISSSNGSKRSKSQPRKKAKVDVKTTSKVECVCTRKTIKDTDELIICQKCKSAQHASCLKFDYGNVKNYICHICYPHEEPLQVKATLIVTPLVIRDQWVAEINNCIKTHHLSVFIYEGRSKQMIVPSAFSEYDIVITTYDVLSNEFKFANFEKNRWTTSLRRSTQGKKLYSPLPFVRWWRVCLDEAQMIEGISKNMSQMAKELKTVHRWCITGTPMHSGIQDLYGLVSFLGISPIHEERWWKWLVCEPYYRRNTSVVLNLFGQIMWRRSKKEISDQLGIPPQTNVNHWLSFSPVEMYFYVQQFKLTGKKILDQIDYILRDRRITSDKKLSTLDRYILEQLMRKFLEIRQACCHPQAVQADNAPLSEFKMKVFTMDSFLDDLIAKNYKESNECLLGIFRCLNKLGRLYLQNKREVDTFNQCKQIFELEKKYGEKLIIRGREILKAVELFLQSCGGSKSKVMQRNRKEANDLKVKYNGKYSALVKEAQASCEKKVAQTDKLCQRVHWSWLDILISERSTEIKETLPTIKQTIIKNGLGNSSLLNSLTVHSLIDGITEKMKYLLDTRKEVNNLMNSFVKLERRGESDFSKLLGCYNCIPDLENDDNESLNLSEECSLCDAKSKINNYENLILNRDKKERTTIWDHLTIAEQQRQLAMMEKEFNDEDGHYCISSDHRSDTEIVVHLILELAKALGVQPNIVTEGNTVLELFSSMNEEVECHKDLFTKLADERLGKSGVKIKEVKALKSTKLAQEVKEISDECADFQITLSSNMGSLFYLENLKMNGSSGTRNDEDCQICCDTLGMEYSVLTCAHFFCTTCVRRLCDENNRISLQCPICRTNMKYSDVRQVVRNLSDFQDDGQSTSSSAKKCGPEGQPLLIPTRVKGDVSTKVGGILEIVLKIREEFPGEKVLVYSSWKDMLDLIEFAMGINGIKYFRIKTGGARGFVNKLNEFKYNPNFQVFLMPLKMASTGLNIIEATHVMFVEPLLNSATELQAIGRIHRIGQTKPTFVHRFYVKDTIEEHLYEISKSRVLNADDTSDEGGLTLKNLRDMVEGSQ